MCQNRAKHGSHSKRFNDRNRPGLILVAKPAHAQLAFGSAHIYFHARLPFLAGAPIDRLQQGIT
jgi:hypothetical protein